MSQQNLTEARRFETVVAVFDRYEHDSACLIPILQAIQDEYRYLPEEIMTYVATALEISPAKVYRVATFFGHFSLSPRGKYIVKVCDRTACYVKGKNNRRHAFYTRNGFLPRGMQSRAGHGDQR